MLTTCTPATIYVVEDAWLRSRAAAETCRRTGSRTFSGPPDLSTTVRRRHRRGSRPRSFTCLAIIYQIIARLSRRAGFLLVCRPQGFDPVPDWMILAIVGEGCDGMISRTAGIGVSTRGEKPAGGRRSANTESSPVSGGETFICAEESARWSVTERSKPLQTLTACKSKLSLSVLQSETMDRSSAKCSLTFS